MKFKKITSVVLCAAMLLTSIDFNFALDGDTINSLCQDVDGSKYYSTNVDKNNTNEKDLIKVEPVLKDENKTDVDNKENNKENNNEEENDAATGDASENEAEGSTVNTDDKKNNEDKTGEEKTAENKTSEDKDDEDKTNTSEQAVDEIKNDVEASTSDADRVDDVTNEAEDDQVVLENEVKASTSDADTIQNEGEAENATNVVASISELLIEEINSIATKSSLLGAPNEVIENNKKQKKKNYINAAKPAGFTVDIVERDDKNESGLFGTDPIDEPYYDMTQHNNYYGVRIVPPVRDQNPFGTCWAFSTVGMVETSLRIKNLVQSESDPGADLSEAALAYFTMEGLEYVTDPDKPTYSIDTPGVGGADFTCINRDYDWESLGKNRATVSFATCGGDQTQGAIIASSFVGLVSEDDFPHTEANINDIIENGIGDRADYAFNRNRFEILDVDFINNNDIITAKEAILKHGSIGMSYSENRDDTNCHKNPNNNEWYYLTPDFTYKINPDGSLGPTKNVTINHSVMIVGWDDEVESSNFYYDGYEYAERGNYVIGSYSFIEDSTGVYYPAYSKPESRTNKKGAWLVRNSWGDDNYLAKEGYFWISYWDKNLDGIFYAIDADVADTYKYNYHYDTTLDLSTYRLNNLGEVANIFKVSDDINQLLEAVTVAWQSANTNYKIKIYQNDNPMNNPTDGALVLTQSVHHDTAGIHLVKLNESLLLGRGTYYSIVICDPSSWNYDIFADCSATGSDSSMLCYNEVHEKESWYGGPDDWHDFNAVPSFVVGDRKYGKSIRIKGLTNEAKVITFNAGGGEGEMAIQGGKEGDTIHLNANEFTREYYTFYKWIDGDGNEYDDGGDITLTDDVTLTAEWTPIPFTITYNLNRGDWEGTYTAPTSWTVESAATTDLPTGANITREHYDFGGWYENSDFSGSQISDLDGITRDLILYAKWIFNPGTATYSQITFLPNGGTGTMEPQYAFAGDNITLYANEFTRAGYTFNKWTSSDGRTFTNEQNIGEVTEDIELFAEWTKNPTPPPAPSPSGGSSSSGGGGGGPIIPNDQAPQTTVVSSVKESYPAIDASQATWVYDPQTNKFKLNVDINGQKLPASNGFFTINEVDAINVNNLLVPVSVQNTYYFNASGEMVTGFVKTSDGKTYFFENAKTKDEGKMVVGWKKIQNDWYFFNADGAMLVNGITPDGYQIGADGKMKTA